MPRYKRTAEEAELDIPLEPEIAPEYVETRSQLRNMWEFAALMQYIYLFGDVVKIDQKFEIETLEAECLKPEASDKLAQIGLQMLKYVSSHRGLTPDIFDEYTRRQYLAKAPQRNPFGDEEEPAKFNDFDVFTKVRVLHQLSVWTLGNVDRIRGLMPADTDHLEWRMEPLGWDKEDRSYYILDDNRLYRRTDEVPLPLSPKPKAKKSKPAAKKSTSRGTRASKRRKVEESDDDADKVKEEAAEDTQDGDDTKMTNGTNEDVSEGEPGYGFTSKTWECVAVTLDDYTDFLASIFRTRDANERHLRKSIEEGVIPIIEERAERIRNQKLKEMRDLEVQAQMATAKRSGRLAQKQERDRIEQEQREAEEKKRTELREAHAEEERLRRIEEGHESRRQTREQRLKEREMKRILHEEQLAKLEEDATRASSQDPALDSSEGIKRVSNRHNKTERERVKKELDKLAEDEDSWYFDCVKCHKHGENFDDGAHSIACEKCNVWQHSECHGIKPEQAEDEDFHFICSRCKQKEADAKKPKIAPIKLGKNPSSSSPQETKTSSRPSSKQSNRTPRPSLPEHIARQLDGVYAFSPQTSAHASMSNPLAPLPYGHQQRLPAVGNFAPRPQQFSPPQQAWNGNSLPPPQRPSSSGYASSPPPHTANGYGSPQQQHQQQHQNMHQHAMNMAGGHPAYHGQPYPPSPANGYSPRAPPGVYPAQSPPPNPQQYQYYHPPSQHYQQQPPLAQQQYHPYQYGQRPVSQGQLSNGIQSPMNAPANPSNGSLAPPAQHQQQSPERARRPSYGHAQTPSQATQSPHPPVSQPQSGFAWSPAVNFPPQQQHAAQHVPSPVKSSPPPSNKHYSHQALDPTPRPTVQTPQATLHQQPHHSNGNTMPFQHQTPILAPSPKVSSPQITTIPVKKVPASAPTPEHLPPVPTMSEAPAMAKPAIEGNGHTGEGQ